MSDSSVATNMRHEVTYSDHYYNCHWTRCIDVICNLQKYRTDAGSGNINTWDYPTGLIPGEAAGLPGGSQKKMLATVRS